MKVDFKRIPVKDLEGNITETNISKELSQVIYADAREIKDLDLALDIYKHGELDINDEQLEVIKKYLSNYFKAFVQKAFNDYIDTLK